jgi:hypothetical protein
MPLYNTATVASALNVTPKWLDNLLSHNDITGLQTESQGVARRLSFRTVSIISITDQLVRTMELPSSAALKIAEQLVASPAGEITPSPVVRLSVDLPGLHADVLARLAHAIETAPTPRRGRPPKR